MKHNQSNEHPEVNELKNICSISPELGICNKISKDKRDKKDKKETREAKQIEDKQLDTRLKGTFPASDATAEY